MNNVAFSAELPIALKAALNKLRAYKPLSDDLCMSVGSYVMNYRYIGLRLPRQCGKSRWIAENSRAGDLILCPNLDMADNMKKTYHVNAYAYQQIPASRVYGTPYHQSHTPQVIFLDEVNHEMLAVAISRIVSPHQIIVSLGT